MKYLVQVNRHLMTTVEAESPLGAEHKILDLDGIQYSNAFDPESWKTDTFRGAMLDCQTISFEELVKLTTSYTESWQEVGKAKDGMTAAAHEVERITALLQEAKEREAAAQRNYRDCLRAAQQTKTTLYLDD